MADFYLSKAEYVAKLISSKSLYTQILTRRGELSWFRGKDGTCMLETVINLPLNIVKRIKKPKSKQRSKQVAGFNIQQDGHISDNSTTTYFVSYAYSLLAEIVLNQDENLSAQYLAASNKVLQHVIDTHNVSNSNCIYPYSLQKRVYLLVMRIEQMNYGLKDTDSLFNDDAWNDVMNSNQVALRELHRVQVFLQRGGVAIIYDIVYYSFLIFNAYYFSCDILVASSILSSFFLFNKIKFLLKFLDKKFDFIINDNNI